MKRGEGGRRQELGRRTGSRDGENVAAEKRSSKGQLTLSISLSPGVTPTSVQWREGRLCS